MKSAQLAAYDEPDPGSVAPIFSSVLCGIGGTRGDDEAARQAASLAGPGGHLELLAVTREWGYGAGSQDALGSRRAHEALRAARAVARELEVEPDVRTVDAGSRTEALLAEANGHGLLVVGADGATRAQGILLGATVPTLVHRAPCPVLVARRPPAGVLFPKLVLLADDGSDSARGAARLAAELAARRDATVELISPRDTDPGRVSVVAQDATAIYLAADAEPVRVRENGRVVDAIVSAATRLEVSLVVTGSRGLRGVRALASVSERVATRAPCSVLVARPAG
jgi:nucleotide-binding universal stress UspA family protein